MIASHIAALRTSLNQRQSVIEHARSLTDMRVLIIFAVISVLWVVVCSSPIDPTRLLINRPRDHDIFKRSLQVKGGKPGVKGYNPPMPALRKGEYICGNKVCQLQPGQIPPGCNGVCQYRVA